MRSRFDLLFFKIQIMFNLSSLIRPNIAALKPYVSARSQYVGDSILMDANENPFGDGRVNRYPDPYQSDLRKALAERNYVYENQVLLGNGSDELIDMLMRVFCVPGKDSILICPPTFGMYEVVASVNDVSTESIPLTKTYQLDVALILKSSAKILFLPCPNSPTGNVFNPQDIEIILSEFKGLVVLDEAYVDFSESESWLNSLNKFENLVVLQTFSKYWALAGCRIGMVFASSLIIEVMSKIKMPYNLNNLSSKKALEAIENESLVRANADIIISERKILQEALSRFSFVKKVFSTQTNFLWLEVRGASKLQLFFRESGIIIRGYDAYPDFLRISVGSSVENKMLLALLKNYQS